MARSRLERLTITGAGGINQQVEQASLNQLADARNLWAPDGRLEARPGYIGHYAGFIGLGDNVSIDPGGGANDRIVWFYDGGTTTYSVPAGTTQDLANAEARVITTASPPVESTVGDHFGYWIGVDGTTVPSTGVCGVYGFHTGASTDNTNATTVIPEYWNGTYWKGIPGFMELLDFTTKGRATNFLGGLAGVQAYAWLFPPMGDLTAGVFDTIHGTSLDFPGGTATDAAGYFIRFRIYDADIDAECDVSATTARILTPLDSTFTTSLGQIHYAGLLPLQFSGTKKYVQIVAQLDPAGGNDGTFIYGLWRDSRGDVISSISRTMPSTDAKAPDSRELATVGVVAQFDEAFIGHAHRVYRATPGTIAEATVSTDDFSIGSGAPYADDYVVKEGAFPKANYVEFFKGRLWFSGIENYPFEVRWSAPQPHHKVIPSINAEPLVEDDNSPITGMKALGEYMVVFKRDSIWVMVESGITEFGTATYTPIRVVAGVGCVCNASIQKIRGQLIFLSEDGVYAFDGTPQIKKISDRINETVADITPGFWHLATSMHWREKSCYVLTVSLKGDAAPGTGRNNTTLVYDYKNDSWWIWDNIYAAYWTVDEDTNDLTQIFFGDKDGRVFKFDGGLASDNFTAITSYATTHRIGMDDNTKRRLRSVELISNNKAGSSVTVEALANDESSGTTATLDFTDTTEKDWGTFSWASGATTDNNWTTQRRRAKRVSFRKDFDWLQLKVTHSTIHQKFECSSIDVGVKSLGRR